MLYILEYTPKYKIYRCRIKHKYFCSVYLSEAVFTCSKFKSNEWQKTNSANIHLFMRICFMTHELYSSGQPHYQENLHTLIFKIQSANQSAPALLSLHVSLRVGSFPAPPSWATCGDGTTCSVMEICCELVVRSNQSLEQVESWLK